jgi:hypothetical protein
MYLCGLLKIEFTNQKRSISITLFGFNIGYNARHEIYSFMDGYNGYNQVKMAEIVFFKMSFIF